MYCCPRPPAATGSSPSTGCEKRTGARFIAGDAALACQGISGEANLTHMMEIPAMSDDYARGRRDGLRLALSVLVAEEAKWEALLGQSPSWRTNATRAIRHKAYQVAVKRVQTALNRLLPKSESALPAEIASMLDQAGL